MDKIEVKTLLQIQTTNHDGYLDAIIPLIIEWVQGYCHQSFENDQEELKLPGGAKIFVAQACEFNMNQAGMQSESLGDYSVSYTTDYPESMMKLLRPYRKVSWS
jgi:hypothetical protein